MTQTRRPSWPQTWYTTLITFKKLKSILLTLMMLVGLATTASAQQKIDFFKINGTAVDTNSGNKSGGTQRFVLATDQPNLTTPLNINWSQIAGTTVSFNNGTVDNGTIRVTIASNSSGVIGVTGTFWQATQPISGTVTATQGTGTNLHMVCDSGCSSSTAPADASTFTPSTTPQSPVGGFFQTTATNNALTNLQMGAIQLTAQRAVFSNLRNASGTEVGVAATPLQVSLANTAGNASAIQVQESGTHVLVDDAVFTPATTKVVMAGFTADETATDSVNEGDGGAARMTTDRVVWAAPAAVNSTSQATLNCYLTSAASTNATNCKASAGNIYAIHVTNTTTTNYFLRLYNLSSSPTCSSSTGFIETIPALGATANGGVNGRVVPAGEAYDTGIGFCLTGGGSSTDNTNAATGVYITIKYK